MHIPRQLFVLHRGRILLITALVVISAVTLTAQDGTVDSVFGATGTRTLAIGSADDRAGYVALQADGKIVVAGNSMIGSELDFTVVRYHTDGTLDASFSGDGIAVNSLNAGDEEARGIAVQSDGKIVGAGYSFAGPNENFALIRYTTEGSLDTTFDGDGIVITDFGTNSEEPYNIGIQSDGKIVVVGYVYNGSNSDIALARYNSDGSLDTTFNGTGTVVTVIPASDEEAKGIAFQSNGKIVVAGHSNGDAMILRYNTDGALDTSFNATGMAVIDVASDYEEAYNIAIQSDGKIVVGGYTNAGSFYNVLLIRVDSTGTMDPAFDGDGIVSTDVGTLNEEAKSIAIQSDGKIVAAGYYDNGITSSALVLRYNNDGTLDNTFATNGIDTANIGTGSNYFNDIVLQTDNAIVVAGSYHNGSNQDFAVRRYTSDGNEDGNFHPGTGKVTTVILNDSYANAVALQSDGKLLAGGAAWDGSQTYFAIARYTSNGLLDDTFGAEGIVTTAVGSGSDQVFSIVLQPDGKIIAAGTSNNGSQNVFAVVRYDSTGVPDNSFGSNGIVTTPIGSFSTVAYGAAVQSDGKILIVGDANNQIVVVRYNANGTVDTTFDADGIVSTPVAGTYAEGKAIALQADGKIVVAGNTDDGTNADVAVVRFHSNGTLDTTFNATGKATAAFGSDFDQAFAVAVQTDGKIVVGGNYSNGANSDFFVARFNSNGTLDTTFSSDGKAMTAIGSGNDDGKSIVLQSDGKIIIAGDTDNGTDTDFGIVRFNSDGTLDNDFDGDGIVTTAIGSSYDRAYSVLLQSDDNIVVAGSANNGTTSEFALVRYLSTSVPVIALSYSATAFSEASANDGSIDNNTPMTITLSNDTFTGSDNDDFVAGGKVTAANLPAGLTAVVTRTSSTAVSVTLTGNASSHAAGNSVLDFTLTFHNSAFTGSSAAGVTNAVKNDLQISFNDPSSNNVLSFDGANDVVSVPASSSINLSQGTWEAWVKIHTLSHHHRVLFKEGSDNTGKYELYILDNSFGGSIRADVVVAGVRYNAISSVNATTGTWYHLAVTFDDTDLKIYVNGALCGTVTIDGAPQAIDANTGPLGIGGNVTGEPSAFFEGEIDEVRIWNIARTASEIAADMNTLSLSPSTAGLTALYHFDQGTAGGTNTSVTTLYDETANSNDGTLNNFALTGPSSNFISNDIPLPVELVSFTAAVQSHAVELQWKTATERNNYGFEIERRKDELGSVKWRKIGFVEGSGTVSVPRQYSYTDKHLDAGKYVYRLKQIDRDGKFTYSQEIEATTAITPKAFALMQNYPNPFNPSTTINYQLPIAGYVTLKVYDAIGREVATLVHEVKEAGYYSATLNASALSSGIYFARLQGGSRVRLIKMVLMK